MMRLFVISVVCVLFLSCGKSANTNIGSSSPLVSQGEIDTLALLHKLNGYWMNTSVMKIIRDSNSVFAIEDIQPPELYFQDSLFNPYTAVYSDLDYYFKRLSNDTLYFTFENDIVFPLQFFGDSIQTYEGKQRYTFIRGNIWDFMDEYLFEGNYKVIYDSLALCNDKEIVLSGGNAIKGLSAYDNFYTYYLDDDTELFEDYIIFRSMGNKDNDLWLHWEKTGNRLYFYKYLAGNTSIDDNHNEKQLALILERTE